MSPAIELLRADAAVVRAEADRGQIYRRVLLANGYERVAGSHISERDAREARPNGRFCKVVYEPDLGGDCWTVYARVPSKGARQ